LKSIKSDREYKEVLKTGKKIRSKVGTILYVNANESKYGIITSKKLGSAVIRNRIKRRIKEALKAIDFGIMEGKIMVFIPNKGSEDLKFSILKEKIEEMLGAV